MFRDAALVGSDKQKKFRESLAGGGEMAASKRKLVCFTCIAVCAALCGIGTSATSSKTVKTAEGPVQGTDQSGVTSYLGVPYAAPPVGDLRWRAPQPTPVRHNVLQANHFGHDCIQNGLGDPGAQPTSEDCLYLNLWTPSAKHAGKLPVMIYIHGGGFNIGSGAQVAYQGDSLARRGVIVVNFNYRLGRFGFFAHPALTHENPSGPLGNYQVLDQIAAVKWVKRNIAAFGGDPNNITIFGESSGGVSVNFLMTSPAATGLFSKAIVESGVRTLSMKTLAQGEADGKAAAERWDVHTDDLAALRRVPAATVLGKSTMGSGGGGPVIDGTIIREIPIAAFREGHMAHVPYLIGTNSYEAGTFLGFAKGLSKKMGALWPQALALYDGYGTHQTDLVEGELMTDILTAEPTREVARFAAKAGLPTYVYQFDYVRPSQRGKVPGAVHGDEFYAVFGTMKVVEPKETPDMQRTIDEVQSRWVTFAKYGQPTMDPKSWPAFKPDDEEILEFTQDGSPVVRKNLHNDRMEFVSTLPPMIP